MTGYRQAFYWAPGHRALATRCVADIARVVVHRIAVSQEDPTYRDTPAEVARFFRTHPVGQKATGGGMPYPLLVGPDGTITQTVALSRVTPHARAHNPTSLGVAALGDFRVAPPTPAQRRALVWLCSHLLQRLELTVTALSGHDELHGASADPEKICPGSYLPVAALRQDVAALMAARRAVLELVW